MESIQSGAMALQTATVSSDKKLRSPAEIHGAIASLSKATKLNTVHLMKEIKAYFDKERKDSPYDAERRSIVEIRMRDVQFTPNSYANLCAMYSKSQTKMFGFHAGGDASSYRRILERLDVVARESLQKFVESNFIEFVNSVFNDVNLESTDPKNEISDHQAQTELTRFCSIVKAAHIDEQRRGTKEEKPFHCIFNQIDFSDSENVQEKAERMLALSQQLKDRALDHGVDQYLLLELNNYIKSGQHFMARNTPNRGGGYESMRGTLRRVAKEAIYENPQEASPDSIYMNPSSLSAIAPELPQRPETKPRSASSASNASNGSTSSGERPTPKPRKLSLRGDKPVPAPRRGSVQSSGSNTLPPLSKVRDSINSLNLNEPTDLR